VLAGDSAGAHLSMLTAYTIDTPNLPPSCPVTVAPVRAVVSLYGITYSNNQVESDVMPISYVRQGLPPTLLIQGTNDHGRHDVTADRADAGRVDAGTLRPGVGAGVPLRNWLQWVIWDSMLSIFDVVIRPGASLAPLPLALARVAAFVFARRGAALPARWAPATPVAQVLRSE
jgi:acetyl esterase/lipase